MGHDHVVHGLGPQPLRLEHGQQARHRVARAHVHEGRAAALHDEVAASKNGRTNPVSMAVIPWPRSSNAGVPMRRILPQDPRPASACGCSLRARGDLFYDGGRGGDDVALLDVPDLWTASAVAGGGVPLRDAPRAGGGARRRRRRARGAAPPSPQASGVAGPPFAALPGT